MGDKAQLYNASLAVGPKCTTNITHNAAGTLQQWVAGWPRGGQEVGYARNGAYGMSTLEDSWETHREKKNYCLSFFYSISWLL